MRFALTKSTMLDSFRLRPGGMSRGLIADMEGYDTPEAQEMLDGLIRDGFLFVDPKSENIKISDAGLKALASE